MRIFYTALLAAATFHGALFAQGNGAISGSVKDTNGGMAVNATVTAADTVLGVSQVVHTGVAGDFNFPLLPPGTYTITTELIGFKKNIKNNVVVPVSTKVNVGDVVLELGSLSESITITAEAAQLQIQTESGERSNLVTNRQLRDIALNGRNVVDLMRSIPGVLAGGVTANAASTVTNITGGFSINGTRSAETIGPLIWVSPVCCGL